MRFERALAVRADVKTQLSERCARDATPVERRDDDVGMMM